MRIGLFGGSFDPAHPGHLHVAQTALKRLGLHKVWWLVTPQNPLKPESAPLARRVASAKRMAKQPAMEVAAFESACGFRYTYQTVRALTRAFPRTHFVLIVGADSLESFRYWRRWREVMRTLPLAVVSRPLAGARARLAKPAQVFASARKPSEHAARLAVTPAPAWTLLTARFHRDSSSLLRAMAEPGES